MSNSMNVQSIIPQAPLSQFVDLIWYCEGYDPPHRKERLLPNGGMNLIINLSDAPIRIYDQAEQDIFQEYPNCLICGVQSDYVVNDTRCQSLVMGIVFKAGRTLPFFKTPADEFRDQYVPLDCMWKINAHDLHDRLLATDTVQAKFEVVEHYLLQQLCDATIGHRAVEYALNRFQRLPHRQTIAELSDEIGLSQARFVQVFREAVGVTPKLYCRIRRFQGVLQRIRRSQETDWAEIALAFGYYDQAHFIHDFQAFSGISPVTYQNLQTRDTNHVPL